MKRKVLPLLIFGCVWIASCKNSSSSKCGPCPEYAQVAPVVRVKIVDKTTGGDLFLSPNSPYKYSDLKITTSLPGQDVYASVDSTEKDNRSVRIIATATQTFTLQLASLPPDKITYMAKLDSPACCPQLKVNKILLNDSVICAPCTYDETVTIKK